MRTLVTGGAGFIGSTLVDRLLAEGHTVDVIDDLSTGSLANLSDARALRRRSTRPSIRWMCARPRWSTSWPVGVPRWCSIWRPRPTSGYRWPSRFRCRGQHPRDPPGPGRGPGGPRRRIVFAASGGTLYGDPDPSELPLRESLPHRPLSPYGVAKKASIDYLVAYRELYSLEFVALALANVYGPGKIPTARPGVVAIFAERLLRGEPITIFGDGEQTRDFVFVDDVVDAFVRASTRGGGLICNIGTSRETSVNQLLTEMAHQANLDVQPTFQPLRPGELLRNVLDTSRAGIHLGWSAWTDLGRAPLPSWTSSGSAMRRRPADDSAPGDS